MKVLTSKLHRDSVNELAEIACYHIKKYESTDDKFHLYQYYKCMNILFPDTLTEKLPESDKEV